MKITLQVSLILVLFLFANTVGAVSTLRSRLGSSNTSVKSISQQKKEVTINYMGITLNPETCVNDAESYNKFKFDKRYIGGYHSTGIIAYGYLVSEKYNMCFIN